MGTGTDNGQRISQGAASGYPVQFPAMRGGVKSAVNANHSVNSFEPKL
jgi:hypothetical protein